METRSVDESAFKNLLLADLHRQVQVPKVKNSFIHPSAHETYKLTLLLYTLIKNYLLKSN